MRNLFPFLGAAKRKTAWPRSRLCAAVILGNIRANGVPKRQEHAALACFDRLSLRPLYASATKCAYDLIAQLVQRSALLREPRPRPPVGALSISGRTQGKTASRRSLRNPIRRFDQTAVAKGFINPPSRSCSSATRAAMAFSSRQLASFGSASAASSFALSSSIKCISLLILPVQLSCCGDNGWFDASAISTACTSHTVAADVALSSACSTVSVASPVAAWSASAARSASAAQKQSLCLNHTVSWRYNASIIRVTSPYPKRDAQAAVSPNPRAIITGAHIRRVSGSAAGAGAVCALAV
jgi:hypothetical protein